MQQRFPSEGAATKLSLKLNPRQRLTDTLMRLAQIADLQQPTDMHAILINNGFKPLHFGVVY